MAIGALQISRPQGNGFDFDCFFQILSVYNNINCLQSCQWNLSVFEVQTPSGERRVGASGHPQHHSTLYDSI
jgi:hypothetical protein